MVPNRTAQLHYAIETQDITIAIIIIMGEISVATTSYYTPLACYSLRRLLPMEMIDPPLSSKYSEITAERISQPLDLSGDSA